MNPVDMALCRSCMCHVGATLSVSDPATFQIILLNHIGSSNETPTSGAQG